MLAARGPVVAIIGLDNVHSRCPQRQYYYILICMMHKATHIRVPQQVGTHNILQQSYITPITVIITAGTYSFDGMYSKRSMDCCMQLFILDPFTKTAQV